MGPPGLGRGCHPSRGFSSQMLSVLTACVWHTPRAAIQARVSCSPPALALHHVSHEAPFRDSLQQGCLEASYCGHQALCGKIQSKQQAEVLQGMKGDLSVGSGRFRVPAEEERGMLLCSFNSSDLLWAQRNAEGRDLCRDSEQVGERS